MIVLRNKKFSFMEALKGNPKLRMSLLEYHRLKPDGNVIDEFPDLVGHDDFLKYLTWLNKNIPNKPVLINSGNSALLITYPFENILKQDNGKYPMAVQRTGEKRFVLLSTNYGDNDFVIS